jgi:AraC-like DNA-binding protein
MSRSRQDDEPDVRGYSVTHPPGRAVLPIEAGWDQLLYAASGTMTIATPSGSWVIPPSRALWIPDSAPATIVNRFPVAVRSLYFASSLRALPAVNRAIAVHGLVRELLLHAVRSSPLRLDHRVHSALITVLVDQLHGLPEAPLWLPWPSDQRAVDAAELIANDPTRDLRLVAGRVGAGRRTLERAFVADTGMTLGGWRRRARILRSLDSLSAGISVTETAISAGYTTPSSYVAAFRQELGQTPRQFVGLRSSGL